MRVKTPNRVRRTRLAVAVAALMIGSATPTVASAANSLSSRTETTGEKRCWIAEGLVLKCIEVVVISCTGGLACDD